MIRMHEKILLIQLFSNGDCLYATAVARQVKQDYPNCYLIWMVSDSCNRILFNNPFIDELIVITGINYLNWEEKWSGFKKQLRNTMVERQITKSFFTQIIGDNFANYDYCIRSTIFRGYDKPVTVPIRPVLRLTDLEKRNVEDFVNFHQLPTYSLVILFEFAPRSGQAKFTLSKAMEIAQLVTQSDAGIAIVMSSNINLGDINKRIIDGSILSLRETAQLSHHCGLLVGSSSGITWVTTSDAGKELPMVQILDQNAYWLNSVSNDRKRFGKNTDDIIELTDDMVDHLVFCIRSIREDGFVKARIKYHQEIPQSFRVSRGLIFYLLRKRNFRGVVRHIRINIGLFGWNSKLILSIFLGIFTFPVMLLKKSIKIGTK